MSRWTVVDPLTHRPLTFPSWISNNIFSPKISRKRATCVDRPIDPPLPVLKTCFFVIFLNELALFRENLVVFWKIFSSIGPIDYSGWVRSRIQIPNPNPESRKSKFISRIPKSVISIPNPDPESRNLKFQSRIPIPNPEIWNFNPESRSRIPNFGVGIGIWSGSSGFQSRMPTSAYVSYSMVRPLSFEICFCSIN